MRVAFQGLPGAYSESAALEYLGTDIKTVPCESFEAVFFEVQNGTSDLGLLPIENSLAGSIHRNYDLLLQNSLAIVGEYHLKVEHCLVAFPGVSINDISKVTSHPQALAQCDGYLRQLGVTTTAAYDTAGSVKIIIEEGDHNQAAIASRRAAQLYEMNVLAESIEDDPANFTRFLAVATHPLTPSGDAKTSIVFTMINVPGALFKALSVFALRDIDLTKIESRPLVGKPGDYLYYIDFAGSTADQRVANALNNLEEYTLTLRVLGSYPRHRLNHQ